MAHAHPPSGKYLLYRNRLLTIRNKFHEIATSSDLLSSEPLDTFGPQRVTHRSTLVIPRALTGSNSRVNLNAGTDISRTERTRVRVGAPFKSIT